MEIPRKIVERYTESFMFMSFNRFKELKEFVNNQNLPDNARAHVEMDRDYSPNYLYFVYEEPETDEEYEARCKKEYYEQKRIADDELTMYKILKKKFEGE